MWIGREGGRGGRKGERERGMRMDRLFQIVGRHGEMILTFGKYIRR